MSKAKATGTKFVLASTALDRAVIWPCTILVPQDDGGKVEQSVKAKFKVLAPEEQAIITNPLNMPGQDSDIAILKRILVGFSELEDESRTAVPDDKAIDLMLRLPYAVRGLVRGYADMVSGRVSGN